MNIVKKILDFFSKKKHKSIPLVMIKRFTDDGNVVEYNSIEEAIADLENDPNVPTEKIEKLKSSFANLKTKTSIKIRNGEIIK